MMRRLRDLTSAAADHFSYLLVYAPEFPEEDATDGEQECDRLLAMLRDIDGRTTATARRQWLRLAIKEVEDAREGFRSKSPEVANNLLHSAEEHFKAYVSGRRGRVSFLAGPDGTVERVHG
jgi:hypothetical protein